MPKRRSVQQELAALYRQWSEAVESENKELFKLLLKAWGVREGTSEERLAWEAWEMKIALKRRVARSRQPSR